jgi:hypothetical protein
MVLFEKLVVLLPGTPYHCSPCRCVTIACAGVKTPMQWIQQVMNTATGMQHILSIFQPQAAAFPNKETVFQSRLDEINGWYTTLITSLDFLTWLARLFSERMMGTLYELFTQSKIFALLLHFMNTFSMLPKSAPLFTAKVSVACTSYLPAVLHAKNLLVHTTRAGAVPHAQVCSYHSHVPIHSTADRQIQR